VPDHSTFSKNRHGRLRDSDLLRHVFEAVVRRCMAQGLVGGDGVAVDGSLIKADASSRKGVRRPGPSARGVQRAVDEYLAVLDDAAFGAATEVTPKFISPADPAARWTGAHGGQAFFAYAASYLVDLAHGIVVDVEATTAVRQAEVTAAKRMSSGRWTASTSIRPGSPAIAPTARPRCSAGWSMSTGSSRMSRCSTNPRAETARSRGRTSPMTTKGTSMSARRARC
jgi:hypothetical protein